MALRAIPSPIKPKSLRAQSHSLQKPRAGPALYVMGNKTEFTLKLDSMTLYMGIID